MTNRTKRNHELPYFRTGSVVYFLRLGTKPGGPIKIGWSENLQRRYNELQFRHKEMLKILCVIPGGRALEDAFHSALAKFHLPGEGSDRGVDGGTEWFACPWLERYATTLHRNDVSVAAVGELADRPAELRAHVASILQIWQEGEET